MECQGIIQKNMGASVFGQAKNDCSWGSGGERRGCKNPNNFFHIKHAKTVIVRVNIE